MVAHLAFVIAKESFATVTGDDATFLAVGFDELHEAAELFVGNLQLRIGRGSPDREYREQAPFLKSASDEELLDFGEFIVVAGSYAGNHVEAKIGSGAGHADSLFGPLKTAGHSAHPVVVVSQAIERNCHGAKASPQEAAELFRSHGETVGHHAPGELHVVKGLAALLQIGTEKRLATGNDHHYLVGIKACRLDAPEHAQEVFQRHVFGFGKNLAVASAMAAVKVTPKGALPEYLPDGMTRDGVVQYFTVEFQGKTMPQIQGAHYSPSFFSSTALAVMVNSPSYQRPSPFWVCSIVTALPLSSFVLKEPFSAPSTSSNLTTIPSIPGQS